MKVEELEDLAREQGKIISFVASHASDPRLASWMTDGRGHKFRRYEGYGEEDSPPILRIIATNGEVLSQQELNDLEEWYWHAAGVKR